MSDFLVEISESFPSEKKSISFIEPLIDILKKSITLPLEKYYNILISVTEAVNNAIIHGNNCDYNKKVTFTIKANQSKILISVKDQGTGFDPDQLLDPTQPDNLLKENGRGVFLIRELCDNVKIIPSTNGTQVIMEFYLAEDLVR
jgi:serine/threonine-protein kinase RsbW